MRYHIQWNTYGSWLPGDPRGFRTKGHRMHVEGDYRNPPPEGTYDNLHAFVQSHMSNDEVIIPPDLRPAVGNACLEQFGIEDVYVYKLSVGGQHVHVAIDCLPDGLKQMIGRIKKVSSHRVRDQLPGKVWSHGCNIVTVRDEQHWRNVLNYIADHARNSWVWLGQDPDHHPHLP